MRLSSTVSKMLSEKSKHQLPLKWKLFQKHLFQMPKLLKWKELWIKFTLLPKTMLTLQTKLLVILLISKTLLNLQEINLRLKLEDGKLKERMSDKDTNMPSSLILLKFIMMLQDQDTPEALNSPTLTKSSKTGEMLSKLTKTLETKSNQMSTPTNNKLLHPELP